MIIMREVNFVFSIVIISFMLLHVQVSSQAQTGQFPTQSEAKEYVTDFLNDYNALVDSEYSHKANFDNIKSWFSAYEPVGDSFKAIVMPQAPNDSNFLAIVFFPIVANQPNVTVTTQESFCSYTQKTICFHNETQILMNVFIGRGGFENYTGLILFLPAGNVSSNIVTNAESDANALFEANVKTMVESTTTSGTQNSISTNIESFGNDFYLYVVLPIVILFGSVIEGLTRIDKKIKKLIKDRKKKNNNIVNSYQSECSQSPS